MLGLPEVSAPRAREIVREIAAASRVRGRFFVLLITASMIASFGLIANSTAVIIGAMLVSPLMTPIFGAALGMLRGNPRLLGRAVWSEVLGVILAVGAAYLVGLPQLSFGATTPEMLARTHPNLLDLLVAVFAGFAGTYALLDDRVSPALPGVAIATAIVPPLSTCGLCLSLGAWSGAGGAMLLFLANFVSILVVALVMFWAGGLARGRGHSLRRVIVHFGPTVAAFILIAVILTNSLLRITRDRALEICITDTLHQQLAFKHGAELEEHMYRRTPQGLQVMAIVRSHRTISPTWVTAIEQALESSTGESVDMVVRTVRSRDVCSLGSSLQAVRPNLDGVFLVEKANDFEARESLASQVVREFFENEPGFELTRVEYGISHEGESAIVAYTNAIRLLTQSEVLKLEAKLQERFEDPNLHFFVRVNSSRLRGREGTILVEWSNVRSAGPERIQRLPEIEKAIRSAVKLIPDASPLRVHFNWSDDRWRALIEVIGADRLTTSNVAQVREALPKEFAEQIEILLWRRNDFIVTENGYSDYEQLVEPEIEQRSQQLRDLFRTSSFPKP
jgi:uncharacterized hydrophobic protein (TIGR00271 family)